MNIAEEITNAKEGGRRKIFKVKIIDIYGWDDVFIIRTLNRGEILDAFKTAGYPGRVIPDTDKRAQAIMENKIVTLSAIHVPSNFDLRTCHAGVPAILAKTILEQSGFVEGSKKQKEALSLAADYANSSEGLGDGLILHTIPSITLYDLDTMTIEEWAKYLTLSINIQKNFYGREENVLAYLNQDRTLIKETNITQVVQRDAIDDVLRSPVRVPGLNNTASEDDSGVFKATRNLSVQEGQKLLDILKNQPSYLASFKKK